MTCETSNYCLSNLFGGVLTSTSNGSAAAPTVVHLLNWTPSGHDKKCNKLKCKLGLGKGDELAEISIFRRKAVEAFCAGCRKEYIAFILTVIS